MLLKQFLLLINILNEHRNSRGVNKFIPRKFIMDLIFLEQGLFKKVRACVRFSEKAKKKNKMFENLGKNVQNLKIFWKRAGDCVQLSHAKEF